MVNIESYISRLTEMMQEKFGQRLLYLGLQGSYLRGEATETSDIDVMIIFDEIDAPTLDTYRDLLISVGDYDRSCGFVCSRADMAAWNTPEVCHLLHTTRDLYGRLADFVPAYTREDVIQYVKMSIGNLYHELVHRYLHADAEKNKRSLPYSYKSVFFILQSVYYLKTGVFYQTKKELTEHLSGIDRDVMQRALSLASGGDFELYEEFSDLLEWCKATLRSF